MSVVIDIHCHVLHADAVEIASFVDAYAGSGLPLHGPLRRAAMLLIELAVRLFTRRDRTLLERLERLARTAAILAELVTVARELDEDAASELSGLALRVIGLPAEEAAEDVGESMDRIPNLGYVWQFAKAFTNRPRGIVDELTDSYQNDQVDLFVPLMTDYENWLSGEPVWYAWRTSGHHEDESRVEFKKKVIEESRGRIHLFAPFCPLRAAAGDVGTEVQKVADLVRHDGFLGVKLYPIMGYYPWDNEHRAPEEWIPQEFRDAGVTWQLVDAALAELYNVCAAEGIPITVHCSPQGARGPHGPDPADKTENPKKLFGPDNHSHPYHWEQVLTHYGDLRLNLAHMAGDHFQNVVGMVVDHESWEGHAVYDWAYAITGLMKESNHVYADRSCQVPPTDPQELSAYTQRHVHVFGLSPTVPQRMMHGSDWHLVLLYTGEHRDVLRRFKDLLPQEYHDGFFGTNAAQFLGICSGNDAENPGRVRLDSYYEGKYGSYRPGWWDKV